MRAWCCTSLSWWLKRTVIDWGWIEMEHMNDIECLCMCPGCGSAISVPRPEAMHTVVIAYCSPRCREKIQLGHPNKTPTVELPALPW